MADSVDIDLYDDDLEPDFNQEGDYNHGDGVDLYDDVITSSTQDDRDHHDHDDEMSMGGMGGPHGAKRIPLYVGNLTWWTTDQDIADAIHTLCINDLIEIKFYENRANGQSKGFCVITLGSETSSRVILDKLPKKELHGQVPVVTHCNRQALNQFEQQSRKSGQGNGEERQPSMGRGGQPMPPRGGPMPGGGGMPRGRGVPQFPPPPMGPPPLGGPPPYPPDYSQMPPGMRPNGPPPGPHNMPPPRSMIPGGPPPIPGGPPPPPGMPGPLPPRPGGPPPPGLVRSMPPPHGMPPRGPPPDPRGPPPRPEWIRPVGPGFMPQQPPPVGPMVPGTPLAVRGPPPGGPPPGHMPPPSQAPAPHVNPAFFPPAQQPPNNSLPPGAQPSDMYSRPHPGPYNDFRPPDRRALYRDSADVMPPISEAEFEEIMTRNRTVSSSAIARAVSDASNGEYASAIETLVTAISLIKQSKVANDERCKILISSLQDTLHGIESKSYGSRSKDRARSRERSRERERSSHRDKGRSRRADRSRSREREYRERSRERDRYHDERYREKDRERDREREHRSSRH